MFVWPLQVAYPSPNKENLTLFFYQYLQLLRCPYFNYGGSYLCECATLAMIGANYRYFSDARKYQPNIGSEI